MSIVARVLLALDFLVDVFMAVLYAYGREFLEFMLEALEKPWLVKR